jgi:tetratricopeptide (TPR) repeat protein
MTYLLILFAFTVLSDPPEKTYKDLEYEDRLLIGIESFYQADWEEAREIFEGMKADQPDDPRPYFFESMMPFLEYFLVDPKRELAEDFLAKSEKAVDLSNARLEKSPNDTTMVLMLSGLHGYRGLVAAGENQYRIALSSGLTGFNYTRKLLSINSDRADARIGRGMFYYMVGSIPSGMRWASNIIGMSASIEDGFEELKKAAESDSYIRNDAKMILMYLYSKEERYDEALIYAERLTDALPGNVIFLFKKAEILEHLGNKQEALNVYKSIVEMNNPSLLSITEKSAEKIGEIEKLTQNY